uniref:HSF-type DNA-binding domain-containing protein n=1 Tax=Mycena chlorophos TaxID=658473 RepID=A0ABQ0LL18_MYCCL|nr:predicted protein [Mycena chlorophos]
MVVDSEVAGSNPSPTEHEEHEKTFLSRLFRISQDKTNASVVGWTSDGHLAVYDPDKLPEVLGLGLTFGGFWREMTKHGFVMKAMRYHHFDSTGRIFYAWKHPVYTSYYQGEDDIDVSGSSIVTDAGPTRALNAGNTPGGDAGR